MIDVRLEIEADEATFVTGPIRNQRALDALLVARGRLPEGRLQVHDDAAHHASSDAALEAARRERTLSLLIWGGRRQYCCEIAPLSRPAGTALPRARGHEPEPRELRGPTQEEIAAHTISPPLEHFNMVFDHGGGRNGGGRRRAPQAAAPRGETQPHAEAQRRRGQADHSSEDQAASLRAVVAGDTAPPRETFWIEPELPRWVLWIRELLDLALTAIFGGRIHVAPAREHAPQGKETGHG
jgi:hypothetical protein